MYDVIMVAGSLHRGALPMVSGAGWCVHTALAADRGAPLLRGVPRTVELCFPAPFLSVLALDDNDVRYR